MGLIPGLGRSPEKGMAIHSSILFWRISWMEEPGRLESMGSQRVRQDWICQLVRKWSKNMGKGNQADLRGRWRWGSIEFLLLWHLLMLFVIKTLSQLGRQWDCGSGCWEGKQCTGGHWLCSPQGWTLTAQNVSGGRLQVLKIAPSASCSGPGEGGKFRLRQDAEWVLVAVARNSLAASLPPPGRAGRRRVCLWGGEGSHGSQGPQPPPVHTAGAAGRATWKERAQVQGVFVARRAGIL